MIRSVERLVTTLSTDAKHMTGMDAMRGGLAVRDDKIWFGQLVFHIDFAQCQ